MSIMTILLWLVFGAFVGWVASLIMGTNESQGLVKDILLGIVGAFVGGFVFQLLGFAPATGLDLYSIFVALIGAVLVVWVGRALTEATA